MGSRSSPTCSKEQVGYSKQRQELIIIGCNQLSGVGCKSLIMIQSHNALKHCAIKNFQKNGIQQLYAFEIYNIIKQGVQKFPTDNRIRISIIKYKLRHRKSKYSLSTPLTVRRTLYLQTGNVFSQRFCRAKYVMWITFFFIIIFCKF